MEPTIWKDIQGWTKKNGGFLDLYQEMIDNASDTHESVFVEVGAWKGKSSAYMAEAIKISGKPIKFYVIDTWAGSVEHKERMVDELPTLYQTFKKNMKPLEGYYHPIQGASEIAYTNFEEGSLDFVFIDGSHEYEDVVKDINNWTTRLDSRGVLAGDDIGWRGVQDALKDTDTDYVIRGDGKKQYWVKK